MFKLPFPCFPILQFLHSVQVKINLSIRAMETVVPAKMTLPVIQVGLIRELLLQKCSILNLETVIPAQEPC
ncbi:MAG: hypothetical protein D3911_04285 [Candidatus Electrothrix sp. AW3_4]|nr:hypothetical protein [Candidatus Electrothrix gigas]